MINKVLEEIINTSLKELNYEYEAKVIESNRKELCDYQCDSCFILAKTYKKSPLMIGNEIVENILKKEYYQFKNIEVVNPGFINMTLSNQFINDILIHMNENEKLGIKKPDIIETFVLDYGGPNIAKPLHVGHMRTAIVGESIKRIINYVGHKTISDVHLGDYGLQIGQVIYGILEDNIKIEDITLEYLENTYPKISSLCKENEEIKEKCAIITKKLQEGNEEYQKLWKMICEVSGNDIKRLYNYLDVSFDLWLGESDSYKYIDTVTKILNEKKLLIDSENAKIINVCEDTDKKELPPLIYQKSNGAYLYGTTDLATIYEREKDYHPSHILYIVDNRQGLHFEQVFRASKKANLTASKLEFLGYGTVNGIDGKPYKTRQGDAPKLDNLFEQVKGIFLEKKEDNKDMPKEDIDKIVNSILKFADLQNSRERDYIFDINKFSNVIGKTGPYILYTYLRINKILENNKIAKMSNNIYNNDDRALRLKLLEFENILNNAFRERMPSYIAEYIYELALLTNTFYQNNRIQGLEKEVQKSDWLYLLNLTTKVLKEALSLIMIDIPKYM